MENAPVCVNVPTAEPITRTPLKEDSILIRYVLKRLLWLIPIIIIVSFLVYALIDAAPGDFLDAVQIDNATPEQLAEIRAQYGLDQPLVIRYGLYMIRFFQGDMGISYVTKLSVWNTFIQRLPNTLYLSLAALIIGASVSVPVGIGAAKRAGKISDNLTTTFSLIGLSMPGFWLGILLLMLFSQILGWLPAGGMQHGFSSFILPAVCSGLLLMATATRQTRSSMLEVLNADFLRTARAKGVPEKTVIRRHALGNAWIPILTTIGMSLSISLAGSAIIENVFAWPGIGRLLVESVTQRDIPMITGTVIMTTIIYVLILLIVDLSYSFVDPRIKSQYVTRNKKRKIQSKIKKAASENQPSEGAAPFRQENRAVLEPDSPVVTSQPDKEDVPPVYSELPPENVVSYRTREVSQDGIKLIAIGREQLPDTDTDEDITEGAAKGLLVSEKYRKRSQFGELMHHIKQNKGAVAGIVIIAIVIIMFLASLFLSFESVTAMDVPNRYSPPSWRFPFGTDNSGRNLFLRVVYGSRYSLVIGLGSTLIQLIPGLLLGAIAGYYGGKLDDIIMRISDILASIPGLLLGIVIVSVLGQNLWNLILAVGVTGIPIYIRITRAAILTVRNSEFVEASRAIGFSNMRIIATQILPNGLAPIIVTVTTSLGVVIIIASSLSFLGFGVPVPHPEWGALVSSGKDYMRTAPWLTAFPGLLIMFIVLGFNMLGDGLRDAMDPKLKRR